jgi:hypothetical protein
MENEPKMVPCPDCGGTGKIAPALDNLPGQYRRWKPTARAALEKSGNNKWGSSFPASGLPLKLGRQDCSLEFASAGECGRTSVPSTTELPKRSRSAVPQLPSDYPIRPAPFSN